MKFKKIGKNLITRAGAVVLALEAGMIPTYAAVTTAQVTAHFNTLTTAIQTVITGIAVAVGVACGLKVIVTKMPNIQEPHVKSEMWTGLGQVLAAVGATAAIVWLAPWIYGLLV